MNLRFTVGHPPDATNPNIIRIEIFDPYSNHQGLYRELQLILEASRDKKQHQNLLALKPMIPEIAWNTYYLYGIAVSSLKAETLHVVGTTTHGSGVMVTGTADFESDTRSTS